MFIKKQDQKEILDRIQPLINQLVDERVQRIMNEIQKQQIKSYEEFFAGQEERFAEALRKELQSSSKSNQLSKRLLKMLKAIIKDLKKDYSTIKGLINNPKDYRFNLENIIKPQYFILLMLICFFSGAYISAKYYEVKALEFAQELCGATSFISPEYQGKFNPTFISNSSLSNDSDILQKGLG